MKIKKATLTLVLALAVVLGMIVGANAADTLKTITASLNYGITIKYNGNVQEMKDAGGNRVYPISYEGTTYLPVRAVADMLGIAVNWDGATNTVWLGEGFIPTPSQKEVEANISEGEAWAAERGQGLAGILDYGSDDPNKFEEGAEQGREGDPSLRVNMS